MDSSHKMEISHHMTCFQFLKTILTLFHIAEVNMHYDTFMLLLLSFCSLIDPTFLIIWKNLLQKLLFCASRERESHMGLEKFL